MVIQSKRIQISSNGGVLVSSTPNENPSTYIRRDTNLVVPATGKFVQIKHWNELKTEDNAKPYPEIIDKNCGLVTRYNGVEYDYEELQDRWQWFLWNFWDWGSQYRLPRGRIESFYSRPNNSRIFAKTTPGSLTYVYVDMVEAHRAFTEDGSPEAGKRDVVTNRNLSEAEGYSWLLRPCGGHLAKVIRTEGVYYVLEAIDLLLPCPTIEEITSKPWLYFWATQYDKFNGATRFPQIKTANEVHGLPAAGTPCPFFSLGGEVKIRKSSCNEMENGQSWTPYSH